MDSPDSAAADQSPAAQKSPGGLRRLYALLRQNWPEYVLEIITIMLSITLSFALDEWKDERSEQKTQQIYLRSFYSNIETDIDQLTEIIAETKQIVANARTLLPAKGNALPTDKQFIEAVKFVAKRPRFVAEEATFADLRSTGNMRLLTDFRLKSAMFDYYKHYESIQLVEAAELTLTNTILGPYLIKNIPLGGTANQLGYAGSSALAASFEFQNNILVRLSTRGELLEDYTVALQKAQALKRMVKQQLE